MPDSISTAKAGWDLLTKPQRAAFSLFNDSLAALKDMSKASAPKPEDVLKQVTSMASAMGDLAGATVLPLEYLVNGQKQLAETLAAYAVLQRQLADVVETAAANQAAIVAALELMTNPVVGTGRWMRSAQGEAPGDAQGDGSDSPAIK